MNVKRIIVIISIFLFASCAVCEEVGLDWTKIAPNNYVDMDAIVGTEDYYGFSFLLKAYNKGQYEPIYNQQILYTLSQYELDCGRHSYKIGVIDSYDEDGDFISSDYNRYAQFQPIVKDTAVYALSKKLCRP